MKEYFEKIRKGKTQMDEKMKNAIQLAKEGKAEGFDYIYKKTKSSVYFRAKTIMKNKTDVEDLLQEVWLALYQSIRTLENPENIIAWLLAITYRQGMRLYRKRTIQWEELTEEITGEVLAAEKAQPEKAADAKYVSELLQKAIEELSEPQRITILAYYYDEFSVGEIAELMECSEGTVKSRLNYARKKLKEILEKEQKESGYTLYSLSFASIHVGFMYMEQTVMTHKSAGLPDRKAETETTIESADIKKPYSPPKSRRSIKVIIGIITASALVSGVMIGTRLSSQPEQESQTGTAFTEESAADEILDEETTDWNEYLGAWCDKGNEKNTESPKDLYQIILKSVADDNQTVILDAACYEGKHISIEEDLEGKINDNCIEIGFYDFYGTRIEGEITAGKDQLFVVLDEVPEKSRKSDMTYGTADMPMKMNCVMVKDLCADTRDQDRSPWDTVSYAVDSAQGTSEPPESQDLIAEYSEDYVFPNSDKEYLDLNYLRHCTAEYLKYGRNEIFARHGRQFTDPDIQNFFQYRGSSWYHPTLSPEEFEQTVTLNEYETKNAQLILQAERELAARESNGSGFIGIADLYQYGSDPMHIILVKEIYFDHVVVDINVYGAFEQLEYLDINCKIIDDTTVSGNINGIGNIQITWPQNPDGTITVNCPDNNELQKALGFTYWGKTTNPFSN